MLPPSLERSIRDRDHLGTLRRALPRLDSDPAGRLHIVGVHGGAGETTVASLVPDSVEGFGSWPVEPVENGRDPHPTPVVLVARTHVHGLLAASAAVEEWLFGEVFPVWVVGLVLVADAPGRLPRKLRELEQELTQIAPRVWRVPYLRALRTADNPEQIDQERLLLVPLGLEIYSAAHEHRDQLS
jgi:hypothetical protein